MCGKPSCPHRSHQMVVAEFFKVTRARLERIADEKVHDPLPWPVTYIGWSSEPSEREQHHNTRPLKTSFLKRYLVILRCIAYHTDFGHRLLESCLQDYTPGQGFFCRMVILMHPLSPTEAAVAEHVVSILSGSYVSFGGLNGGQGGTGNVTSVAGGLGDDVWRETAEIVHANRVFLQNKNSALQHMRSVSGANTSLDDAAGT